MERRISYFEYQNAVSVAKIIDPLLRDKNKIDAQYEKVIEQQKALKEKQDSLFEKMVAAQKEIDSYQSGIIKYIGFPVTDLVQKVMVPTGKMTPEGKPAMTAEFQPTSKLKYDEATKEYIIDIPEEPALSSDFSEGN